MNLTVPSRPLSPTRAPRGVPLGAVEDVGVGG